MEFDINEVLFNRDYLQGLVSEYALKGLRMTPFFEPVRIDDDTFTWIKDDSNPEKAIATGQQHKPRLLAEGAQLEEIRLEGYSTETGTVTKFGYRLTISNNLLKRRVVLGTLLDKIKKLAYGLGREIEEITYTAAKAKAISEGIYNPSLSKKLIGTQSSVHEALLDLQVAYDLDDYSQELDTLVMTKSDLAAVRKQLNANEIITQNRIIEGWDARGFEYMDTTFMKSSMFQNNGELFGFDKNIPLGNIYYGVEDGAYNPSVVTGMEHIAPIINVTVQEPESWNVPKEYTIRMLASVGVGITSPQRILYSNDFTA